LFFKKDANPRETEAAKADQGGCIVSPDVVVALVLVLFVLESETCGFDADGEVVQLEATDGVEAGDISQQWMSRDHRESWWKIPCT
jgi:hypothetical protein